MMSQQDNMEQGQEMLFNTALLGEIGDKKSLVLVLDFFLINTPKDLTELASFIQLKDYSNIFKKAHRLKGSFSMLRASKMVEILEKMESAAAINEDIKIVELLASDFLEMYQILAKQIQVEIDKLKSSGS